MLIETHAHLDYPDFAPDFDGVLQRATDAGVTRIITIGTSVESSRRAVELAERHANIFAVIGVHPTTADEAGDDVIGPLRDDARQATGLSSRTVLTLVGSHDTASAVVGVPAGDVPFAYIA